MIKKSKTRQGRGYSGFARVLTMLAMLFIAATGAWAQEQWDVVWDFTAWSTETVTALKADAAASKLEGWSDVEKKADAEAGADPTAATKDNCFWSCSGTVNADGNLSANGAVIKEFQGLKFNSDYAAQRKLAIAVNYPSTSLGTYHGPAYLYLGGSKQTCFTIPGVKAGSKITIEVESDNTSSARGIGLYKNSYAAENLIGEQFTPKTFEAKTWEIAEDCNVVVYNTNRCHIYTIKVKAPAGDTKYTVTMAEGTVDAAKWTISPTEAAEGDPVTLQYNGRLKVKSVKAVKKAPANPYANAKLGDLFYSDGTFSTELEAGKTPIGVIAYLGTDAFSENGTTVGGSAFVGHGLVLSLKNAASDVEWGTEKVSKFSGQEVTSVDGLKRTTNVSGYTNTATLTVDAATAEKYPAAYEALNYNGLTAPTGTTGWFLPSAQQWLKMIEGLGGLTDGAPNFDNKFFDNAHTAADKWEAALSKAGSGNYDSMTNDYFWFWSSSECTENEAVSLGVDATYTGYGCGFFWDNEDKGGAHINSRVRPVLAF